MKISRSQLSGSAVAVRFQTCLPRIGGFLAMDMLLPCRQNQETIPYFKYSSFSILQRKGGNHAQNPYIKSKNPSTSLNGFYFPGGEGGI